ncbi:unnamed protein product [Rotaria magnacalcarata]|uniref:Dynein regulatory complex subunit 3 n=1 Tax=Rotaria magnacalcarata TaxID=392030 RepID=A0A8S2R617_9BILA|nr:unnamed protein product [Rotaria magnacalcarata]
MARLYDAIEPEVISMSMLQYAIESLRADGESNVIPKDDKLNYSEVVVLRLDFRNILRMENLWLFTNLTKLQMDNNIIERIEGLETLHKLTWLDLSFNNITRVEGLDSLTELTDLSLYNNRITVLENMDSLKKLNVFSIGNNQVDDENSIRYLRRFDNLRTLCLRGNPFASRQDYYVYTISHLPQVHFLDYKLIDEAPREEATKKYEIQLQQLITLEEQEREKEKTVEDQSKQYRLYKVEKLLKFYLFIEDTIQTFERNLGEMVSNFTESMRANFSQIRELQAYFNESIVNLCVATVERVMKGELEDEFPDDTRELFADKDTIMNACQTSDEFHRTKIDQREDEMFSRISNWLTTMVDNIHDEEEYKRNRKRIIEISRLIDYLRADIEDM